VVEKRNEDGIGIGLFSLLLYFFFFFLLLPSLERERNVEEK